MTFRARYTYLLIAASGLAATSLFFDPDHLTYWLLYLPQWSLIFIAGSEAARNGRSLVFTVLCALPFAAIEFASGSLSFAWRYWTHGPIYEGVDLKLAYAGYILATILFLPVAPLVALLGALGARLALKLSNKGSEAAQPSTPVDAPPKGVAPLS